MISISDPCFSSIIILLHGTREEYYTGEYRLFYNIFRTVLVSVRSFKLLIDMTKRRMNERRKGFATLLTLSVILTVFTFFCDHSAFYTIVVAKANMKYASAYSCRHNIRSLVRTRSLMSWLQFSITYIDDPGVYMAWH